MRQDGSQDFFFLKGDGIELVSLSPNLAKITPPCLMLTSFLDQYWPPPPPQRFVPKNLKKEKKRNKIVKTSFVMSNIQGWLFDGELLIAHLKSSP